MSTLTNGLAPVKMVPNIGIRRPSTGQNIFKPKVDKYVLQQLNYPYQVSDPDDKFFSKRLFDDEFRFTAGKMNALDKDYKEFLEAGDNKRDDSSRFTLETLIDKKNEIEKFYEVKNLLSKEKLSFIQKTLLSNNGILVYAFCRKVFSSTPLNSPEAIVKSILDKSEKGILNEIGTEVIRGATSQMIKDMKIETGTISRVADAIVDTLDGKLVSFKDGKFSDFISGMIKSSVYNADYLEIIDTVKDELGIKETDYPSLISYMKKSSIPVTEDNAAQYLSIALHHLKNDNLNYGVQSTDASADLDFSVTYFEDDALANEIVRENIECSAQLFYVMTLMDELEIYNAVHHIISKYLPSGNVDVRDRELLQDLQLYTFNEEFRDLKNGRIYKKTRTEGRHMFYQQVFNYGSAAVMDGMIRNSDFNHLWESLLLAAIEYIDKSEDSENQAFVSTQKIIQAVEDLQYNLSAHCTGMSKVAAPIINKELTFVVERILKNKEIATQINPMSSASFWKLIEKVVGDMRGRLPNVSALRNKAIFGHKILQTIANFIPGFLDDETRFLDFVSTIEAFIIANSQLEAQYDTSNDEDDDQDGLDEFEYMDTGEDADDWDF